MIIQPSRKLEGKVNEATVMGGFNFRLDKGGHYLIRKTTGPFLDEKEEASDNDLRL